MNFLEPLIPDHYYHIYNRGINKNEIFFDRENYFYFLRKYDKFLSPVIDTYAYCLLKNHFHLLIKIKDEVAINKFYSLNYNESKKSNGLHSIDSVVSKQFARFFSSYTQSINKKYNRTGALFESPFKRVSINSDDYLSYLVWYIHYNPQKHEIIKDFKRYTYSSYPSLISNKKTRLKRVELLNWFGNLNSFYNFHNSFYDESMFNKIIIE